METKSGQTPLVEHTRIEEIPSNKPLMEVILLEVLLKVLELTRDTIICI